MNSLRRLRLAAMLIMSLTPIIAWGFLSKTGKIVALSDGRFAVLTTSGDIIELNQEGRSSKACHLPTTRGALTPLDMTANPSTRSIYTLLSDGDYSSAIATCVVGEKQATIHPVDEFGSFSSIASSNDFVVVASSRTGLLLFLDSSNLTPVRKYVWKHGQRVTSLAYDPGQESILALDGATGDVYELSKEGQENLVGVLQGVLSIVVDTAGRIYGINQAGDVVRTPVAYSLHFKTPGGVAGLAVSQDGKSMAILGFNDNVWLFDVSDGRMLFEYKDLSQEN